MSDALFRRYCRAKGLRGKQKKRLRQTLRAREKLRASANDALPVRPATDELFNLGHGLGAQHA